jgi:hypothetical protein
MLGRTTREFPYKAELWPQVEAWAAAAGYTLAEQQPQRRRYRKGHQLLSAPAFLELTREGDRVTLQAWIKADMYLIMALLTGKPPEAGIESGGLTAWIPRQRARKAVNLLLEKLGVPPVT